MSYRIATLLLAAVALFASGCADGAVESGPATTSFAQTAIHSNLITLALPPGTKISSHADDLEIWQSPGTQEQAVAAVKPQLPIGKDLAGLRWCTAKTDPTSGLVAWSWGGPGGSIRVDVSKTAEIRIEKSARPALGCDA